MNAPITTLALYDSEVEALRTLVRAQLDRLTFYRKEDTPAAVRLAGILDSLEAA